jgi:Fe-S oxidoreductase
VPATGKAAVHDSCVTRHETRMHRAVRKLAREAGAELSEMKGKGKGTLCCGEGGAVGFINEELARTWTRRRAEQAKGRTVITYCAGCAGYLGRDMRAVHLADLLVDPERALAGKARVSSSPMTYLNRRLLKGRLRRLLKA